MAVFFLSSHVYCTGEFLSCLCLTLLPLIFCPSPTSLMLHTTSHLNIQPSRFYHPYRQCIHPFTCSLPRCRVIVVVPVGVSVRLQLPRANNFTLTPIHNPSPTPINDYKSRRRSNGSAMMRRIPTRSTAFNARSGLVSRMAAVV